MTPPFPTDLRRNRDFVVVLFGQGISAFGDAITSTALPLLVLALTGSGTLMGVVAALSTLPDLLVGLPAGAYADRWDRRRMMFVADLGRAALTATIPLTVWLDGPALAAILLVTFPINALRVLWIAGYTAAVPGLVGREHVGRATALFEAFFNVGWIAGPALAGILAATIGPGPTIALDAVTFAVSASALLFVRRPLRPATRADRPRLLDDVREGVRYVARHPTLRAAIGMWTSVQVIQAGIGTAFIFYLEVDRGAGAQAIGAVLSAYAIGSVAGSLTAARLGVRAAGRVMVVGAALSGTVVLPIALEPPIWIVVGASLVAGALLSNVLVSYLTLRTQLSPDELLGRVGSTARTVSVGLMPVGALTAGILLDVVGGAAVLLLIGGATIAAALAFGSLPEIRAARVTGRPATGA